MIESLSLTKYYGPKCVVDQVSFQVKPGEVLGFLGPNGAGKSTTMKMITGFLNPTNGSARIDGVDVVKDPINARKNLGYLPENGPLYEEMTVEEFLRFVSSIRNSTRDTEEQLSAVEDVIKITHLEGVRHQTIDTLSKGFHQRVGVAQAIIHDPKYLILDEPTDGLDPNQKNEVRQLIRRMAESKAIILSTHILEEVEAMCNRVIVISDGKILVDETPESLKQKHPHYNGVELHLSGADIEGIERQLRDSFPELGIESRDNVIEILPASKESIQAKIFNYIHENSWKIESIRPMATPLDDVFRTLTLDPE